MDINEILKHVDHTLLKQTATFAEIKTILDDGIKYKTASCCIPACYVKDAADYAVRRVKICTVTGFPNGYSTTAAKVFESEEAVKNGADEIDAVINIGMLKAANYDYVLNELKALREACADRIFKVILETCLLSDGEILKMGEIVTESKADYIKTSTGFSLRGADFHDIELFKRSIGKNVKIKAAGGIKTLEDAEKYLSMGVDRLGTSSIVKIIKENIKGENNGIN